MGVIEVAEHLAGHDRPALPSDGSHHPHWHLMALDNVEQHLLFECGFTSHIRSIGLTTATFSASAATSGTDATDLQ